MSTPKENILQTLTGLFKELEAARVVIDKHRDYEESIENWNSSPSPDNMDDCSIAKAELDGALYSYGTLPRNEGQEKGVLDAISALIKDNEEWGKSFELYHDAQMRGTKLWQDATGRYDTLPDTTFLVNWLLEELEKAKNNGHIWIDIPQLKLSQTCSRCGIMRRKDGKNKPCIGPIGLRPATGLV